MSDDFHLMHTHYWGGCLHFAGTLYKLVALIVKFKVNVNGKSSNEERLVEFRDLEACVSFSRTRRNDIF